MALELNGTTGVSLVQDGIITAADLASGAITSSALPAGTILQVQTTNVSTPGSQSVTANTYFEITGVSVSITPSSTSSKILLQGSWFGEPSNSAFEYNHMFSFRRDTTYLGSPVAGSRPVGIAMATRTNLNTDAGSTPISLGVMQYVDTPATTSEITYKLFCVSQYTMTLYNNRTVTDSNAVGYERGMSMITAMEIAA